MALALLVSWSAYQIAVALFARDPVSLRLCAAAAFALALLVGEFHVLASVGVFSLAVALPCSAILTFFLSRRLGGRARVALLQDVAALRELLPHSSTRLIVTLACLVPALRLVRGLCAPPLGLDALTYHLARAGLWVQSGASTPFPAPDAWGYYGYFPQGGDAFFAWAMLPTHSDMLVAPAGALLWVALALGVYATGRQLGADKERAVLAAALCAATPAFVAQTTSGHVDVMTAALFGLGLPFLFRAAASGRQADTFVAVLAFGTNATVKHTALPLLVLAVVILGASLFRRRLDNSRRARAAALMVPGVVIAAPPYLRAWIERGSPLYPIPVDVFGFTLSGNPQLAAMHRGDLRPGSPDSVWDLIGKLFVGAAGPDGVHLNLGVSGACLLVMALLGVVVLWRRRQHLPLATLGAVIAVALAPVLSNANVGWRGGWWAGDGVARLMAPAIVASAALASVCRARFARRLIAAGLVVSIAQNWRLGFGAVGWLGGALAVACLAGGVASQVGASWIWRRGWRLAAALLCLFGIGVTGSLLQQVRGRLRYAHYRAAVSGEVFERRPLVRHYAASWPIWEHLDGESAHRIALVAGWDTSGHNWYLYPLLGSRLQNQVRYVPVVDDGTIVDYWRPQDFEGKLDYDAWLGRLAEFGADHLVILAPANVPEAAWVNQHPERFTAAVTGGDATSVAFEINWRDQRR
ncbi:MAG: glycosyltransferase family 39 protein [Deltaproteobacteria bacterium]|nr:glycosyltransferase family 39 protein [Deltaproteobacteria bacterium]